MLKIWNLFIAQRLRILFIVLCHIVYLIYGSNFLVAQIHKQEITERLVIDGFENVALSQHQDTLRVFYENRRYRFEPRGMAQLIDVVGNKKDDSWEVLELVLLREKVLIIQLSFKLSDYVNFLNDSISGADFNQKIFASLDVSKFSKVPHELANSSLFKVDIPIIPQWNAKFGNYSNPVESNISLVPELNTTLAKGLTFKAQLIIPIQNDFFFVAERETIRPGNITLNQFLALDDNFYLNLTGGFFNKNRAGANLEFKKIFKEGRFELGANVGFTGYYSFTGIETEFYDEQKYLTAILSTQYRYNPYDLIVKLDVGNFLYNVFAARFEVMRQFGEVQIGFFAVATKDDYDGGFRFLIPLPPGKYTKLKWLRFRPGDDFSWAYRAKGFPQNGVTCNTGYSLTEELMDYNPNFLKKRLIIEINKRNKE